MKKNFARVAFIALVAFVLVALTKSIINIYVGAYNLGIGEIGLSVMALTYIFEILKAYEK